MSTRKEVFSPATIPSTLSSEPVSRTWARELEPGSRHWNNSCRVGLGFGREVVTSAGAPECPCGHSILQVWGGRDLPRGTRASLGTVHLPVSLLATGWAHLCVGAVGLGIPLPSVLIGCIRSRVWGRDLKPWSGMTWAGLISSLNCCHQKGRFSFSLTVFSLLSSVQLSRVRLCDPMNCSTPGLPVYHQLPEFTQTHAHQVSDAIHPPHPLSSPSPPAPSPSQHQGLFQ